jgi:hypothetical protein
MMAAQVIKAATLAVETRSDEQFDDLYNAIVRQAGPMLVAATPASRVPTVEASFMEYGRFVVIGALRREQLQVQWTKVFQVHRDQWEMGYAGIRAEEVARRLAGRLLAEADVYLTLVNKGTERAKALYVSDLSIDYATRVDALVMHAPASWRLCRSFDTWFGTVQAYANLARVGAAVQRMQCVPESRP